jgi:hypothetical protein
LFSPAQGVFSGQWGLLGCLESPVDPNPLVLGDNFVYPAGKVARNLGVCAASIYLKENSGVVEVTSLFYGGWEDKALSFLVGLWYS